MPPCTVSDPGPCPQRWAAAGGQDLSLRLGSPYCPACGPAQLTAVSFLAKGQIPILPRLDQCWNLELLSLSMTQPREGIWGLTG